MSDPSQLPCLCEWTREPGRNWRHNAWTGLKARIHRWRHRGRR